MLNRSRHLHLDLLVHISLQLATVEVHNSPCSSHQNQHQQHKEHHADSRSRLMDHINNQAALAIHQLQLTADLPVEILLITELNLNNPQ